MSDTQGNRIRKTKTHIYNEYSNHLTLTITDAVF